MGSKMWYVCPQIIKTINFFFNILSSLQLFLRFESGNKVFSLLSDKRKHFTLVLGFPTFFYMHNNFRVRL